MASLDTIEALLKEFKKQNDEDHKEMIAHHKETNGNVKANTLFRMKMIGGFAVISFIASANVVGLITLWIKIG